MAKKRVVIGVMTLFLVIVVGTAVWAQTSTNSNLEWHVIAGGGQASNSSHYQINGTIGQSLAGPPSQNGIQTQITSGYWVVGVEQYIYLPTILR
jgi:hypothetical protein